MFILYGLLLGLIAGVLLRGRLSGLAGLRFRWAPLALTGFACQLVLFSDPVAARVGDLGPPLYVGSTVLVLLAVVRNWRIPGMVLVTVGAASNLIAIVANGGYMPTTPEAMAQLGWAGSSAYSNSTVLEDVAFPFLTDIFALPRWLPFTNVYSVGDILIAAGTAVVVVVAMRTGRTATPVAEPPPAPLQAPPARTPAPAVATPSPSRWASGPLVPALSLASVAVFFLVAAMDRGQP